jgi:hypothetical protein
VLRLVHHTPTAQKKRTSKVMDTPMTVLTLLVFMVMRDSPVHFVGKAPLGTCRIDCRRLFFCNIFTKPSSLSKRVWTANLTDEMELRSGLERLRVSCGSAVELQDGTTINAK